MNVAWSPSQGAHYHADAIDLFPLLEIKKGAKQLMVTRIRLTPIRFPTYSLYTPMDNTSLHSIASVCHPWSSYTGVY